MVTDKELEQARQEKDFEEETSLLKTGLAQPPLGPGDSSDSGSDLSASDADTDSDRQNTGQRPQVENTGEEPLSEDLEPDAIVPARKAGLAYTSPDPARNGGDAER